MPSLEISQLQRQDRTRRERLALQDCHLAATHTANLLWPAQRLQPLKATSLSPNPTLGTLSKALASKARTAQSASRTSRNTSSSVFSSRNSLHHHNVATSGPVLSVASETVFWAGAILVEHRSNKINQLRLRRGTASIHPSVCVLPFRMMLRRFNLANPPRAVAEPALASTGRILKRRAKASVLRGVSRFCRAVPA